MGGNAPFLLFADADLNEAVSSAMSSKFRNAGQTCVCSDRFLVHETVIDEFCRLLSIEVGKLQVGNGLEKGVNIGPLISSKQVSIVDQKVNDSLSGGATLISGGTTLPQIGINFYSPTILKNVSTNDDIFKTETFGPVVAVTSFKTDEEAIEVANSTGQGLMAYVFTNNMKRIFDVTNKIEAGMIGVNEGIIGTAFTPFGGVKESGVGREGRSSGLLSYTEQKYVFINT